MFDADVNEVNKAEVNEELVQQWKQQHGDVYKLSGEDDDGKAMAFYFRKPGRSDLSRFTKEVTKDMMKATNNLVFGCLLFPSPDVLRKMAENKPGIVLALGGELQKIVGSNQDFLSEKL